MKAWSLIGLLVWLGCTVPARAELFTIEHRVTAGDEPAELTTVRTALLAGGPRAARFVEQRSFPFRRTPVELQGESQFVPGQALLLSYIEPEPRQVLLTEAGLDEITPNGQRVRRPLPPQYENLFALYHLDLSSLGRGYDAYFEADDTNWALGLERYDEIVRAGNARPVRVRALAITIRGTEGVLTSMDIERGSQVKIRIEIRDSRPLTPEEADALAALLGEEAR